MTYGLKRQPLLAVHNEHYGQQPVRVGPFNIYPGAMHDDQEFDNRRLLVGLTDVPGEKPLRFGSWYMLPADNKHPVCLSSRKEYTILGAPLFGDGDISDSQYRLFEKSVMSRLGHGVELTPFCQNGHGATGTFIAWLIALLEPYTEDPIAAARQRYCVQAVETPAQAQFIAAEQLRAHLARLESGVRTEHESLVTTAQQLGLVAAHNAKKWSLQTLHERIADKRKS